MGVDDGLKLIGCLPEYESIVIDADRQIYYSTGLEDPQGGDEGADADTVPAVPAPGSC